MKKFTTIILSLACTSLLFTGCTKSNDKEAINQKDTVDVTTTDNNENQKVKAEALTVTDYDEAAGADSYANGGDHADSMYYVNPDFYNMTSNDHLTILSNFKTMQQTTEYSCGAASATMILNHYGITEFDEMDLCIKGGVSVDEDTPDALPGSADNYHEYGASVEKVVKMLSDVPGVKVVESSYKPDYKEEDLLSEEDGVTGNDIGNLPGTFTSTSLYASENSDETESWVEDAKDSYFVQWITNNIKNNNCIMVEWGDWDGHWQVIIGYDTMGTPSLGDDIIIFADPYDTSDHWQDGYYYYPTERWFYMWKDRNVAPKPYQLQPYVVISQQ